RRINSPTFLGFAKPESLVFYKGQCYTYIGLTVGRSRLKLKKIFILCISMVLLLSGCSNASTDINTSESVTESVSAMGTITDFTIYGPHSDEAIQKGKEILSDLEQKMSLNIK